MIVRTLADRVQLITQPNHAHLARAIMEHCGTLASHPRHEAILRAIGEHDAGWADEDAAPTIDPRTGQVVDFVSAPLSVRHGVWPRAVTRLANDPWAAALVAHHAITVYDRYRSSNDWTSFFDGLSSLRDHWLQASEHPLDDLVDDYAFVRLGDLISLTFCADWTEPQRFRDWTVERAGTRVTVTPDLFGGAVIPIAIDAKELRNPPFASDEALRHALHRATTIELRGEVAG